MQRKPVVVDQFYAGNKDVLIKQIEDCFTHKFGPGMPNFDKKDNQIKAIISPHAGYMCSGMGAAHVFKALIESEPADVYIILGFSHHGLDGVDITTSLNDWITPLGVAKVDKEFAEYLISKTSIVRNEHSHQYEHSIEVQLPFLQYVKTKAKQDFSFIPLSVGPSVDIKKVGEEMKKALDESKKKICFIISSDFTHYGQSYGFTPFGNNLLEIKGKIKKLDLDALKFIENLDSEGFLKYCKTTGATICGRMPIALMIELIKGKVESKELLKYYASADIFDDNNMSVSYVAMKFE